MKPYLHMSMDSNLDEFPEEREMLVSHRTKIEAQIASLQQVVDFIDEKLNKRSLFPDECPITGENQMSAFEKGTCFPDGHHPNNIHYENPRRPDVGSFDCD